MISNIIKYGSTLYVGIAQKKKMAANTKVTHPYLVAMFAPEASGCLWTSIYMPIYLNAHTAAYPGVLATVTFTQ